MRDSWLELRPRQLSRDRNLELIISLLIIAAPSLNWSNKLTIQKDYQIEAAEMEYHVHIVPVLKSLSTT